MLVVAGATGNAGSAVVRALVEGDQPVRAFVRDGERARSLFGDAVELALGDFGDPVSVSAAFDGAQGVVLSGPDDPRRVGWETRAIDIAAASGVRRIVKLSSIGARPGSPVAFWDWHGRIERHLGESDVPAVILRSNAYMSNVTAGAEQVARERRLYAPAGEARIAMIDPHDVGAAAAAALTTAGHDGRTYTLTGPEAITYAQVAAALSAATGARVDYVQVPDDAATRGMVQAGLPEPVAQGVVEVFAMLRTGAGAPVTAAVESLTGRPPRDFAAFAHDHAHVFAPVAVGAAR